MLALTLQVHTSPSHGLQGEHQQLVESEPWDEASPERQRAAPGPTAPPQRTGVSGHSGGKERESQENLHPPPQTTSSTALSESGNLRGQMSTVTKDSQPAPWITLAEHPPTQSSSCICPLAIDAVKEQEVVGVRTVDDSSG
ncbi:unnamed protein product [Boreogadus saida]